MAEKPKLLDSCREALRIPAECYDFDAEIEDLIEAARAAMRAGGVADTVAADDSNGTVRLAVKVYCRANFGMDNPDADRLAQSFDDLLTMMRGSSEFGGAS